MEQFIADVRNYLDQYSTELITHPVENYLKLLTLISRGIKLMREAETDEAAIKIGTYLKALEVPDHVLLALIEELMWKGRFRGGEHVQTEEDNSFLS